ncbi:MAG TPA: RCC1 domain-containing protein [Polyangia bacterium]|nr:RCC1 domain-containing protein [Polyangia bacterium]
MGRPPFGVILCVVLAGGGCGRSPVLPPQGRPGLTDERDGATPLDADARDADASAFDAGAHDADASAFDAGAHDAETPDAPALDSTLEAPPPPPNRYRVIALSVGRLHACAILDDHHVKCWGENEFGELGLGDTRTRGSDASDMGDNLPTVDLGTGRTARAIATGMYTSCAILDDDTLKCWGAVPPIDPQGNTGDAPGEMGDDLKPIDLGPGRKPVAVAIGWSETCVALDDGSFVCWGPPATTVVAAAADGARVVQLTRDYQTLGVFDDGSVRRISFTSPGGPTPVVFGGRPATFVAGAATNSGYKDCVVLREGGTACNWDFSVQSPPLPATASLVAIALTEYAHACGLDASGAVTCWDLQRQHPDWRVADGTYGVPLGQRATWIGAGDYNACALLADGTVKCWSIDEAYAPSLGGSVATPAGWPAVDLGTRP